jgi:hypothetical protein
VSPKLSTASRQFGQQNVWPARDCIVERSTIGTPHWAQTGIPAREAASEPPCSIAAAQFGQQYILSRRTTWVVGSEIGILQWAHCVAAAGMFGLLG